MADLAAGVVLAEHRHVAQQHGTSDATAQADEHHIGAALTEQSLGEHGGGRVVVHGDGK